MDNAIEYITELGLPFSKLNMAIAKALEALEDSYLYDFWYDVLSDPSAWSEMNLRDLEKAAVRIAQQFS